MVNIKKILFSISMFFSNYAEQALKDFDSIYIVSSEFNSLYSMRDSREPVVAKKAERAIYLIDKYSSKINIIESIYSANSYMSMNNADEKFQICIADKWEKIALTKIFHVKKDLIIFYTPPQLEDNIPIVFELNNIKAIIPFNSYFIYMDENKTFLYKTDDNGDYHEILYQTLKSDEFGEVKPKKLPNGEIDLYQLAAIDSLNNNQITMLRGQSGTGKSYLAVAALFAKLRKHEIDKIFIFCNPIATRDSARLGFYPGSKDAKLLDSQIGNFLDGKIGDRMGVEKLINENKIVLLPMSDIRGFDTNGKKAGIYITEAQNMTIDMLQLALERVGEDCICIIDGDYNRQVDLDIYSDTNNGMRRMSEVFKYQNIYGEVCLQRVYRSKIAELAAQMST